MRKIALFLFIGLSFSAVSQQAIDTVETARGQMSSTKIFMTILLPKQH
jgi:hypothetical protein